MEKKAVLIFSWAVLILLLSGSFLTVNAEESLQAHSAILMEASRGEVIFAQNEHEPLPPASITKIMTMLLIMEALEEGRVSMDDEVVVSEWAAHMGGSQIWLEVGEKMSFEDLFKAVAIASANDASVALAEHIYGSEETFVERMNERGRELGLKNTVFYNCTGLPGEDGQENLTSAYDVALVSKELLNYPQVLDYTRIWIDHLRDGKSVLNNTNRLVRHFPGVDGLKTGFTNEALFCLSATGIRDGVRMIAVVMQAPTSQVRFQEVSQLLTRGFGTFRGVKVAGAGEKVTKVPVTKGEEDFVWGLMEDEVLIPVRRGEEGNFSKRVEWRKNILAPIPRGAVLGKVTFFHEENPVAESNLLAEKEVQRGNWGKLMHEFSDNFLRNLFRILPGQKRELPGDRE